ITATLSGVSGSTVLTVTTATLSTITVTPVNPKIAKGTKQLFLATGNFSDGTTQDITSAVTWASNMTAVATVSNAPGDNGDATGVTAGSAVITATQSGVTGMTTLTV